MLQEGDNYYIVYHRHDNPHSNRGFHRQVAIDKLEFNADGTIKEVVPTHEGIDLKPEMKVAKNLAFGAKVTASSYYDNDFRPEYAVMIVLSSLIRAMATWHASVPAKLSTP